MPNSIKYSTTGDTLSLKKGNLFFGVGDVPKGPSNITQHYNGVTPQSGSYMVYFYDPAQPNNIGFDPVSSDPALVEYTNRMFGTTFTSASQCLAWYSTQPNRSCVNKDYESIVTNGLVLNLDAGFLPSYPTSGTTWYDMGYSGNNGTLINSPTFNPLEGGYINFDGADDYGPVGESSSSTVYGNNQTWSAWINRFSSVNPYNMFMGRQLPYFSFRSNNDFLFSNSIGNNQRSIYSSPIYTNNTWIYASFTTEYVSPNTIMKMYINGVLVNTGEFSGTQTNFPYRFTVGDGRDTSTRWYPFNGKVSNVMVYNRTLTPTEILQNFNTTLSRFNTSNIVKTNLLLNLDSTNSVSYPTTGTVWRDLSGYGNTGTLTNGPTFNSTSKSIVFDGVDDYALSNSNVNITGNNPRTFECWVYVSQSTSKSVMGGGTQTNGTLFDTIIWNQGGYLRVIGHYYGAGFDTASTLPSRNTINLNAWNHIIHTYDGSTSSIFTNGVFSNSGTFSLNTGNASVKLGTGNYTGGYNYFQGNGAIFRVYKQSFTLSDVLQNYYGGPIVTSGLIMALDAGNLVSYVSGATTTYGLTGSNNGTLNNGIGYDDDNSGSWVFDGSDDYISCGNNSSTNFIYTDEFSLESWIKPDNLTGFKHIIGKTFSNYRVAQNFSSVSFRLDSNNIIFQTNGGLVAGKWVHIVATWEPSTFTARIYLNGILEATSTNITVDWTSTINDFQLGNSFGENYYFDGNISIGRVYNKTLSPQEIGQNFNAQKSRFGL